MIDVDAVGAKEAVDENYLCRFLIEGEANVNITVEDYNTLRPETFLNDTIVNVYLKHLQYSKLSATDRDRVHIFSSFWFSRLTAKPNPTEDEQKDPVQRRHEKVKPWTKEVNIFEKDFVVVPINENDHWFLCIICYPGLAQPITMEGGEPCKVPRSQRERMERRKAIKEIRASMKGEGGKKREDTELEVDEAAASEDEIEHEDDPLDLEEWERETNKSCHVAAETRKSSEEEQESVNTERDSDIKGKTK